MALEELTGYPYRIYGPTAMPEDEQPDPSIGYGFHGRDVHPTGADYLCDAPYLGQPRGTGSYYVLMDGPAPPDDLPPGWQAEDVEVDDQWGEDDGVWIVKAIHQKTDGSWVFAGYCR